MAKTKVFKIDPDRPYRKTIESCSRILKKGGVVAFPTETVYGLGADSLNKKAIERIYKVKKRPRSKPLAVQVADIEMIGKMGGVLTPPAKELAKRFWPGPLTIIIKTRAGEKIGFRMPANKVALELIKETGLPLAVSSANVSDKPPAKSAADVLMVFDGKIEAVMDGGRAEIGVESTVVDLTGRSPKILRRGAISEAEIASAITLQIEHDAL